MKTRLVALLLLLVIALTACASGATSEKTGKDPNSIHPSSGRTADGNAIPDVDVGEADGNAYRNMDLAISAEFPEGWYLYNDTDIAALNNLDIDTFDRVAILDAINAGQDVVIFCASEPVSLSSVRISASTNPLPDATEDELVNYFAPLVKESYAQNGTMQDFTCDPNEADFCGADHPALAVTGEADGLQLYETYLYLPCGDLLYTLTVSSGQADMTADVLDYFAAIN